MTTIKINNNDYKSVFFLETIEKYNQDLQNIKILYAQLQAKNAHIEKTLDTENLNNLIDAFQNIDAQLSYLTTDVNHMPCVSSQKIKELNFNKHLLGEKEKEMQQNLQNIYQKYLTEEKQINEMHEHLSNLNKTIFQNVSTLLHYQNNLSQIDAKLKQTDELISSKIKTRKTCFPRVVAKIKSDGINIRPTRTPQNLFTDTDFQVAKQKKDNKIIIPFYFSKMNSDMSYHVTHNFLTTINNIYNLGKDWDKINWEQGTLSLYKKSIWQCININYQITCLDINYGTIVFAVENTLYGNFDIHFVNYKKIITFEKNINVIKLFSANGCLILVENELYKYENETLLHVSSSIANIIDTSPNNSLVSLPDNNTLLFNCFHSKGENKISLPNLQCVSNFIYQDDKIYGWFMVAKERIYFYQCFENKNLLLKTSSIGNNISQIQVLYYNQLYYLLCLENNVPNLKILDKSFMELQHIEILTSLHLTNYHLFQHHNEIIILLLSYSSNNLTMEIQIFNNTCQLLKKLNWPEQNKL